MSIESLDVSASVRWEETRKYESQERPKTRKSVLLIEAASMRRECLEQALRARAKDLYIESVARIEDATVRNPDLVLLGIKANSICQTALYRLAADIDTWFGDVPIAVIADPEDLQFALEASECRFRGYVPTSLTMDVVIAALRLVLAGGTYLSRECLYSAGTAATAPELDCEADAPDLRDASDASFTSREEEVVQQLRHGKPNKIIAHNLGISEGTVKVHLRNIMRKLHATNRTQVAYLTSDGVAKPPAADRLR